MPGRPRFWGAGSGSQISEFFVGKNLKFLYFFDFQQFVIGRKGDRVKNREKC